MPQLSKTTTKTRTTNINNTLTLPVLVILPQPPNVGITAYVLVLGLRLGRCRIRRALQVLHLHLAFSQQECHAAHARAWSPHRHADDDRVCIQVQPWPVRVCTRIRNIGRPHCAGCARPHANWTDTLDETVPEQDCCFYPCHWIVCMDAAYSGMGHIFGLGSFSVEVLSTHHPFSCVIPSIATKENPNDSKSSPSLSSNPC